ncbi:HAD family hydrolase [Candidatus Roizmanbacteria bacterium]|nr:HAD family hydrolase [Candidatus Roizmanbacteria bacterium]
MKPQEKNMSPPKEIGFSNITHVISDWDGTLADSMPAYTAAFVKIMSERYGLDPKKVTSLFHEVAGNPLGFQFKNVLQRLSHLEIENIEELEEEFWGNLAGLRPRILPGAKEFLESLKKKGLSVTVWSGTRTDLLRDNIRNLSLTSSIDFAIGNVPGSTELVKGPYLFQRIAEHFRLSAEALAQRALVIGDGLGDIEAGKAVGAKTAGFGDLKANPGLKDADFVFSDYDSLVKMLG